MGTMLKGPASLRKHKLVVFAVVMTVVYGVAGFLGLQMALPPGYATLIWPPSGIAVAALLIFSPRLAPGIFVSSFVLSWLVGRSLDLGDGGERALAVAVAIATGATLQALASACAVRRLFGVPISLRTVRQAALFGAIVGPLGCLVSASIGTSALLLAGIISPDMIWTNWLTWWMGNLIGVVVMLPLALLGPCRNWGDGWSRDNSAELKTASIIALMIPLCLTFYGWKWTSQIAYERGEAAFVAIAKDNEKALLYRLASYSQALDGASGLFHASTEVTATDWRAFVDALDIGATLPGIIGMGVVDDVADRDLATYAERAAALGVSGLTVHPRPGLRSQHFVTRYIEPLAQNKAVLGLDNAYESNRREAAERARSTGQSTITRRIVLFQDVRARPGFLLFKPVYRPDRMLDTVQDRLSAFENWVYAPFVAERFMENLTSSQNVTLEIQVYDGVGVDPRELIYASQPAGETGGQPTYTVIETIPVMGQHWTIVWNSTPQFDRAILNNESLFVLLGGLLISALFAVFLLSYSRREDTIRLQVVQKTREIAAREQENRAVVNTAVVGILLLNESGQVLSANEAAVDIFGVRPEDIVGMTISDLLKSERGQSVAEMLGAAWSTNSARTNTASGVKRDGRDLYLELQLNPWTTEAREVRFTAIVRDVTLQRQISHSLAEAEERWSTALRGARIGVFDIDLITGQSIVSDTWREMLGFDLSEEIDPQYEWRSRVHPDDLPMMDAADEACFAGLTPRSQGEYRIRHCDGRWIWLRSDATVTLRDEYGFALRLVGTQTDITALKTAEAALRSSEEHLRSAFENAPVGMALIAPDGAWIDVNEALLSILGYSREEFLQIDFRDLTYPEDLVLDQELITQLVAGEIADYQMEKRYVHKEGHPVWGLLSVSVARDTDGRIGYFIAQIQDIEHRKEMDRIKNEFISSVSHELRTPLTSIRGSLGLVMGAMADDVPEGVMRLLTIAHKNSERLILLINDLLDLEKMNSQKLNFDIRTHNLRDEVVLAMETNQSYAAQFDVDFVLDTPELDFACECDSARLQQVLANLLSNAAKFSPPGGTVHLSIVRAGAMARVRITDSGAGIPASFRSRIFSAFSQADSSPTRETGGTGLGLHIARQMTEKMFGALDYSSVEGAGSTFWVDLPLTSAAAQPVPPPGSAELPHMLHVEDDAGFRDFIASALDGKVTISPAPTLLEARRLLAEERFDLVLLDLQLPDGNGSQLFECADWPQDCPVIVLTATEETAVDSRVSVTLVKSRSPEVTIVERILGAVESSPAAGRRNAV